jgi:predicted DNA-binding transcriptional regulator AlpA
MSLGHDDGRKNLPGRMLSTAEAGIYLGLAPITVRKLRCQGGGPKYVKLSARRVGYRLADLESWLASRPTFTSTAEDKAARRCAVAAA